MRVGLLELEQSFKSYSSTGPSFYGYPYYLYNYMKDNNIGMNIDKIGIKRNNQLGKGFSVLFGTMIKNFREYDIVHNLDMNPFFPIRDKKTVVTTAHDFQFVLRPELNTDVTHSFRDRVWLNIITKLGLKSLLRSDYLIAVSTLTKDDAIFLGYPKDKIFVINHGLRKEFRRKKMQQKSNGSFVVGYIGAIRTRKNPQMLFDTFRMLKDNNIRLNIWGKLGYERDKWISYSSKDHRITFLGFAPENKLVDLYDSFDAFFFPSFYEGFGIPIIEAQARGLPVIIYKHAKIPAEVRKYCIEAKSAEHAAQLISTLKENGYNETLKRRSIDYAKKFTLEKTAKKTLEVYSSIL